MSCLRFSGTELERAHEMPNRTLIISSIWHSIKMVMSSLEFSCTNIQVGWNQGWLASVHINEN